MSYCWCIVRRGVAALRGYITAHPETLAKLSDWILLLAMGASLLALRFLTVIACLPAIGGAMLGR